MTDAAAIDKEIVNLYVAEKYPMHKVAKILHVSVGKVFNRLKTLGIPSRKTSDYPTSPKVMAHITALGKSMKGKTHSKETRDKMSIAAKKRFEKTGRGARFLNGLRHRSDGYIGVYVPKHPYASSDGYVMLHRLVMEQHIGRYLKTGEVVHHKNHIRNDNRLENLQLMSVSEHMSFHMKERYKKRRNDLSIK